MADTLRVRRIFFHLPILLLMAPGFLYPGDNPTDEQRPVRLAFVARGEVIAVQRDQGSLRLAAMQGDLAKQSPEGLRKYFLTREKTLVLRDPSGLETGSNSEWTTETDTGSRLDVAHYSDLARLPWSNAVPYRGAYCVRINMGDTNDHTLSSTTIQVATGNVRFFRWMMYLGSDLSATADDIWSVFELQELTDSVVQLTVGLRISTTTGATRYALLGMGRSLTSDLMTTQIETNKWHAIEVQFKQDVSTVADNGAATLYLNGILVQATGAIDGSGGTTGGTGRGVLGTQDTLSTTTGTILLDEFVMDDARVYPIADRYPQSLLLTKTGTVFVGQGRIDDAILMAGGGTDNVLTIYDTDRANTNEASKIVLELKNTVNSEMISAPFPPYYVTRGAYCTLSGTNPRALITIGRAAGYGSAAVVRAQGLASKPNPLEVF